MSTMTGTTAAMTASAMTAAGRLVLACACWAALLAVLLGGCDGVSGTIGLRVVTAPDSQVLERAVRARLSLSEPEAVIEARRAADGTFDLALDVVAEGQSGTITFEGFDASGALVAYGRTGPLPIAAINADLALYVAAPMSIAEAPVVLDPPRAALGATALPYGLLVAGGRDADGAASAELAIYNVYEHSFQPGEPLPMPRIAPVVTGGGAGLVYVFGGLDRLGDSEQATADAWMFNTTVAPRGAYFEMTSDPALARTGASAAPLGQEAYVVTGDPLVAIDGVSRTVSAFRDGPPLQGVAATVLVDDTLHTLIAGQGSGASGATLLRRNLFTELAAPAEIARTGHALAILPDATMLVVAGETRSGLARAAVRFEPRTRELAVVADFLATPRRDAAVAATAEHLIVAGGTGADGAVLADAEIFSATTLERLAVLPLVVARTGAVAAALVNGQVVIIGGTDADGRPIAQIELFTPSPAP